MKLSRRNVLCDATITENDDEPSVEANVEHGAVLLGQRVELQMHVFDEGQIEDRYTRYVLRR